MTQELKDFKHFQEHQLHSIDFNTGIIIAKGGRGGNRMYYDVGSINPDGYVRLWCNKKLRMKHRLVYFLYHGELPGEDEEIDHYDNVRDHNCISNLRILTKSLNNTACSNRKFNWFTKEHIQKVCELLQDTDKSDQSIADITGVSRCTVRDIKTRRSRKVIGSQYTWEHRGY